MNSVHVYELRSHGDKRGVDLLSDVLPFGWLLYGEPKATRQHNRPRLGYYFFDEILRRTDSAFFSALLQKFLKFVRTFQVLDFYFQCLKSLCNMKSFKGLGIEASLKADGRTSAVKVSPYPKREGLATG
jgi:hypothetical protein